MGKEYDTAGEYKERGHIPVAMTTFFLYKLFTELSPDKVWRTRAH
jgi:hypothetical protein